MDTHRISLANGWTAEFTNHGEFRMAAEAWGMILYGSSREPIRFFQERIVLVNDYDGNQARSCMTLSDDGRYAYLKDAMEGAWVIDFELQAIAPHRICFTHHQNDKYVTAFEQPAFNRTQEYVRIAGNLLYITFPFCTDEQLAQVLDGYIATRRRQLDVLYFGNTPD